MSVKQINNMNWRYGAHEKHIKQWFCNINLLGHSSCTVDFCRASVWRFLFFLLNLSHTRASPSPKPFTMVQLTPLIPCDILLQWAAWILGLLWSKCLLWPWWWRREFQNTPWNYIWRGSVAFISTYLKAKKDEGDPGMGIGQHMVVFPLKTLWFPHGDTEAEWKTVVDINLSNLVKSHALTSRRRLGSLLGTSTTLVSLGSLDMLGIGRLNRLILPPKAARIESTCNHQNGLKREGCHKDPLNSQMRCQYWVYVGTFDSISLGPLFLDPHHFSIFSWFLSKQN